MSDCKHCEHLTAYWKDTAGEHKRWQCCHCGRIRGEWECRPCNERCNAAEKAALLREEQ